MVKRSPSPVQILYLKQISLYCCIWSCFLTVVGPHGQSKACVSQENGQQVMGLKSSESFTRWEEKLDWKHQSSQLRPKGLWVKDQTWECSLNDRAILCNPSELLSDTKRQNCTMSPPTFFSFSQNDKQEDYYGKLYCKEKFSMTAFLWTLELGHYQNLPEINWVALKIRNTNHEGRNINPGERKGTSEGQNCRAVLCI